MITVSQRGKDMPASPIRKLVPFAEAAKKRGVKVHHLNIGQPDIARPVPVLDAVKNADIKIIEYSHSAGNESYRRKLADFYNNHGADVAYTDVVVTSGGSEGILFGMLACLNVGDEVIVSDPYYANYGGFAAEAGVNLVPVLSSIEDGFALPKLSAYEAKITSKTKAVIICNPNNPTGYLYSREEIEQLEELVLKHNLFLFSDEAYSDFCYSGTHFSALHLKKAQQQIILIDTISKRYSACGARIGAMVTRNKQVVETVMKFAQARLSPPTFGQIAGEAALSLPPDYFDEVKKEYQLRRDTLVERLNAMPGVFCPIPNGAFYAVASLPIDDCDVFCQWLLESFEYNQQTLMLAPATGFYATPGMGKNQVRLAYVLNVNDINAAMDCLEKALTVYPGSV